MRLPSIVAFGPRRPWARPGESITVDVELALDPRLPAEFTVALVDVDREIIRLDGYAREGTVGRDGSRRRFSVDVTLPSAIRHGYGLRLRASAGGRTAEATSAVEAIDGWWQSPRHAALTEFRDPAASAAAVRGLVGWHVTVAQHYDWMWRHYRYRPPGGEERFTDALGREVSHVAVHAAIDAGHEVGVASLAYGSVYGAEPEYVQRHPDECVFDAQGEPLSLGGRFFINDLRIGSPWSRRILREYRAAVREFGFDGIHMDTYGRPHQAHASDGEYLDFAALYPRLIGEAARGVAAVRRGTRVLLNCVDGFPLEAVATSPVAALYLELWPPDRSFLDVVRWIERATEIARGRAVVVAAYAAALRDLGDSRRRASAFEASLVLGSIITAAGAYHHTLAEGDRILVEGYYPAAIRMRPSEQRAMRSLWSFGARYLHLLSDPGRTPVDVVDLRLLSHGGRTVSTSPRPMAGAVWVAASRLRDGRRVLHLVDLRGQADDHWDEPKAPARPSAGLILEWAGLRRPVAASPWSRRGDALRLRSVGGSDIGWRLPPHRRWLMVVETHVA
jgi:dextranase